MKKESKKPTVRNFVAKFVQRSGAGRHASKQGKDASRPRQKRAWKKEVSQNI